MTIRRHKGRLIGIILWLPIIALIGIGANFMGTDEFIAALLGLLILIASILTIRDWRIRSAIAAITESDDQAIKFIGSQRQSSRAIEIGGAHGWTGSYLPSDNDKMKIVSFIKDENATSATDFLKALYNASLVSKTSQQR